MLFGWLRQKEGLKMLHKEEEERKQVADETAMYKLKLTKLQLKLFWPITVLGAIGGIISLLQIIGLIYMLYIKINIERLNEKVQNHN